MSETFDSTTFITAMLAISIPLAAVLALPVSIGLLRFYRRAVLRSMGTRAALPATETVLPEGSAPTSELRQTTLGLFAQDYDASITTTPATETLQANLLRAPWRAAVIYAVAGACYALVLAVTILVAGSEPITFVRLLLLFWVYAWPVVLAVNLVAASTRRAMLATASVYFLVLTALNTLAVTNSPELRWVDTVLLWLLINLPATILLLTFLNRRVRAVGPLVLTFMILVIMGLQLIIWVILFVGNTDFAVALGLGGKGPFLSLIALGIFLGLTVFGVAGWLTLRWIGNRYEQKKISDQSITLDAIWLMFAIVHSQNLLLLNEGVVWILSGPVAFVVYKVVVWVGFSLRGRQANPTKKSPKLLLLRVFSLGKRSERLFDALATHWRYAGAIQFIAGPDLATTTIEPREFLDFLSGKLARRFIAGPRTLDLRISEMDLQPDRDGRFRVNDFFCHDDTWQMVLSRLEDDSDAVLMDLRGFSQENRGVVYEIEELINVVPMERVVLVVDETTDEEFLRQTVQECWERMKPTSPNRSSTPERFHLFRFTGSHGGELRQLLHALSNAAKPDTVGNGDNLASA